MEVLAVLGIEMTKSAFLKIINDKVSYARERERKNMCFVPPNVLICELCNNMEQSYRGKCSELSSVLKIGEAWNPSFSFKVGLYDDPTMDWYLIDSSG